MTGSGKPGRLTWSALGFGALLLVGALPSCSQTVNVADVYTALDADGLRRRNVFYSDTREIHCVAEVGAGRGNATVQMRVRQVQRYDYPSNRFVDADRLSEQVEFVPEAGGGIQKLDFTMQRTDDEGGGGGEKAYYDPGRYVCEVLLEGQMEGSAIFNIEFPPCPDGFIKPGAACVGFYPLARQCPAFGASSTEPAKCTCDLVKGWDCPQ
jgi:hypothetical protein